jgi:hypothetical protein
VLEQIELRLQRLTLNQIVALMILVTLVFPVTALWQGGHRSGEEWIVDVSIIAVLWIYLPPYWDMNSGAFGVWGGGLHILNPSATIITLILTIFNLIFAVQVIRFCKGEASKRSALVSGLLSLVLPLLMAWQAYSMYVIEFMLGTGLFVYVGPIPIQLIIGLVLMRFAGPWKIDTIWDDDVKEQSEWWEDEQSEQVEQ